MYHEFQSTFQNRAKIYNRRLRNGNLEINPLTARSQTIIAKAIHRTRARFLRKTHYFRLARAIKELSFEQSFERYNLKSLRSNPLMLVLASCYFVRNPFYTQCERIKVLLD